MIFVEFSHTKEENMEKKEISARTTVKAIITGFVSYGIIANFLCLLVLAIVNYFLSSLKGDLTNGLYITVPLIAIIFVYFIVHGICRISTYDTFKKCKTNPENYKKIVKYLNIFFILCIVLSIAIFLGLLYLNLEYQVKSIEFSVLQYKQNFSQEFTDYLKNEMIDTYNVSKSNAITSTIILEIGFMISFISLIPYQRKMILKYNEFEPKKEEQ